MNRWNNLFEKNCVFAFSTAIITLGLFSIIFPTKAFAGFRFIAWGDTKSGTATLTRLSNQAKSLNPIFTIYSGDAISSGSALSSYQTFGNAANGGSSNGILGKTFAVRGNHDSSAATTWAQFFEFASAASSIGATNYSSLNTDLTYSFDYQNAHFVGIDNLGSATGISAAQIAWLDQDLTRAESRGIKHAFLFSHGPIYTVDGHMASVPTSLVTVLNKHPILTATFHGHEHVEAHTTIDSSRISQITNFIYEQFVTGTAGAGGYSCTSGRSDYCQNFQGFMVIDVLSDTQFKVGIYKDGTASAQWERTFTKGKPLSSTPTINATKTPTPRSSASPTPGGSILGDVNKDGHVNILDFQLLSNSFGKSQGQTGYNPNADFNKDNSVNVLDFQILSNNFGK